MLCNNLYQYGIPFSLTETHTVLPTTEEFKAELDKFAGVCRVVRGLKSARIGAIGARPNIFNNVCYSEKLLKAYGISLNTVDLSEMFGAADRLAEDDKRVTGRLKEITDLQPLLRYICKNGFEHHAAVSASSYTAVLAEAFETYLEWKVYCH